MRAIFLTTVMSLCAVAYGQAATGLGNGGGSQFEIGARAAGMAGAYITGGDDASIVFYNPATLGVWDSLRLTGGYGYLSGDGFAGFGALVLGDTLPKIGGTIGIGYHVVSLDNITLRGYRNRSVYDSSSRQAVISYGRHLSEINERLSVGATVRYARIRGLQGKDHATELDLGLRYVHRYWKWAAVGRNLTGSKLDLGDDGHPLRASAVVGGAYTSGWLDPGIKLQGAVDYEALKDAADRVHIGAEMRWLAGDNLTLAIRTGYVTGVSQRGRPSVGMGVRWNVLDLGLELDYAYFRNEDAPHVDKYGHTISFSVQPQRIIHGLYSRLSASQTFDEAAIVNEAFDKRYKHFDRLRTRYDDLVSQYDTLDSDDRTSVYRDSALWAGHQALPFATTGNRPVLAQTEVNRLEKERGKELEELRNDLADLADTRRLLTDAENELAETKDDVKDKADQLEQQSQQIAKLEGLKADFLMMADQQIADSCYRHGLEIMEVVLARTPEDNLQSQRKETLKVEADIVGTNIRADYVVSLPKGKMMRAYDLCCDLLRVNWRSNEIKNAKEDSSIVRRQLETLCLVYQGLDELFVRGQNSNWSDYFQRASSLSATAASKHLDLKPVVDSLWNLLKQ